VKLNKIYNTEVKVQETHPAFELENAITRESGYGSSRQQDTNRQ
jgi:hypothetical protein